MKLRFPFSFGQLVCLLLAAVPGAALAQSVGVGTTTPHPSAALEVASTGKGLLLPRLTQAQRTAIAGPAPGLIVYQTDGAAGFWYYSGTQWLPLQGSGSADNLGNHTATQNLQLGTNLLVGNGGTSGLAISNSGNVGIGTSSPTQTLDVNGNLRLRGLSGPGQRLPAVQPDGTLGVSAPYGTTAAVPTFPTAPAGSVGTGSFPYGVAVNGTTAYVVNFFGNSLQVFDVSNPTAPILRGSVGTGSLPISVAVNGTTAYVVNYVGNTLQAFDVSNPTAPALLGSVGTGNFPRAVTMSGTTAYVVNGASNTLQVFDVSNPTTLTLRSSVGTGNGPRGVTMSGTTAYVVNDTDNSLQVFDVSNPTAPILRGGVGTGDGPYGVAVKGTTAYVVNYRANTLQAFDVSNPAAPALLGTVNAGDGPYGVAVNGTTAYVVNFNGNTFQAFEVSDPAAPALLGTVGAGGPIGVAVSGQTVCVAASSANTLQVFSFPRPPRVLTVDQDGALASTPLPNPANYVQNRTSPQANSNFNITGTGLIGGSLGVGTTALTARLDVRGAGGLRVYTSNPGTGANDWFSSFGGAAGTQMPRVVAGTLNGAATLGGHLFDLTNTALGWSNLALNPGGGNVGIGTSNPTARLHVVGNTLLTGNLTTTGAASVASATVSGALTANSATVTATVSAASATVSGTLTAGPTTVSGVGGLRVSSTNPGSGIIDWIACNMGGTTGDRVVSGLLNGVATVGAHNNALAAWAPLALNPGGNVGIGTFTPGEKLHVVGNAYVQGNVTLTGQFTSAGPVSFCGGAYTCSDRRYKRDITPLRSALENVLKLNGYTYFWKQAAFPEKQFTADRQLGFIAQEVEALYPEMVMTDPKTGYKSVDYAKMTPVLLEAIKELSAKLDAATARAARAEAEAAAVTSALTSFEARLRALETGGARAGR